MNCSVYELKYYLPYSATAAVDHPTANTRSRSRQ